MVFDITDVFLINIEIVNSQLIFDIKYSPPILNDIQGFLKQGVHLVNRQYYNFSFQLFLFHK